jgi:transposase
MLVVETIAKIRRMYHTDGKSIRGIARDLGISKNTVKKVIRSNATKFELAGYERNKPVIGNYLDHLHELLESNLKEPLRRRMTAIKLYEELKKVGYTGSYQPVNLAVRVFRREHEAHGKQAFVPLLFDPGQAFQFDWGLEEVEIAGKLTKVKAARIKLCHSRHSLVLIYPNERLEMVIAAHDEAFRFFSGACKNGIYDNMKTAIKKILLGKERELNETFAEMSSHYLFEPIACTPASGWEKGRVEKQVGDTRRNFFTPLLKGESFEDINNKLKDMCIAWSMNHKHPEFKNRTVYDVYNDEKQCLIPYQGEFTVYKLHPTIVSPTCLVNYDTNSYSVECAYVGLSVQIKAYAWEVFILHDGKTIGKHKRLFDKYQHIYDPWHYVPVLERKPGALRNGAPFKCLLDNLPLPLREFRNKLNSHKNADKEFIAILLYVTKYGLALVSDACAKVLGIGSCSISLVGNYLSPQKLSVDTVTVLDLQEVPHADCTVYNHIYLRGGIHAIN